MRWRWQGWFAQRGIKPGTRLNGIDMAPQPRPMTRENGFSGFAGGGARRSCVRG